MALTPRQQRLYEQLLAAALAHDLRALRRISDAATTTDRKAICDAAITELTDDIYREIN